MSVIHPASKIATIPELDIFEMPSTQTAVDFMYLLDIRPISAITEGSVVEFTMGGENRDYLYPKGSRLCATVRVVHADGTPLHVQKVDANGLPLDESLPDEIVSPANLCLHSMFSQIDIYLNGFRMTQASNMYGYKAFILTELGYGQEAKKTQLAAQGYKLEKGKDLDVYSVGNTGMYWRQQLFKGSKTVDLEGPLLEDVMQIEKFLLNGMHLQLKLYPALQKFFLMAEDITKGYKVELVDIVFRACMVRVNPGVIVGHATALEKSNAVYPFIRRETKSYSISKDTSNVYLDNMFPGNRPSKVIFALVASAGFNGDLKRNPFKFAHFNLSDIRFVVDGQTVPGPAQKLDFDATKGRKFIQSYLSLYANQSRGGNYGPGGITPELFANGHAIFVYNLDPVINLTDTKYINLKRQSNVRLELNFSKPLEETVTVLIIAEYETFFEIDSPRNVVMGD